MFISANNIYVQRNYYVPNGYLRTFGGVLIWKQPGMESGKQRIHHATVAIDSRLCPSCNLHLAPHFIFKLGHYL